MPEPRKCSSCGAEVPVDSPSSLCPRCSPHSGAAGSVLLPLPLSEKPGDKIGRYKLLQEIGAGGFGVVYMAEQEEPVRRRVALKIIKLGMDTKEVIARFEAERQALALMDHPHIAKVLDAGATAGGRPYFVMELVKGERITEYCDKNNLTTRQRLDLFVQICQAIQHAHQKGIIHRDIKPSNILVAMQDGVPVPKVIDFGIAKATEQRLTDKTFFTAMGDFIGTPAYMSPEQAEMTGLDIDTRSDIYSLGVLLYELLTGKTPFDPKEWLAKGIEEMRRAIREEEPRRPSTRLTTMDAGELTTTAKRRQTDAPKLVHLVRGDLDWIVMKCLEKDRTRRYETANGLALDLQRHLSNEPVLARPPSKAYRFQKMARRNKAAFATAALIALVLLVATGISVWQAVRATRAQTLANQRLAESEAISKFLTEVFQSPDPARDGRTITVAETLGAAAKKLDTELISQPLRRAKLQATLGLTYHALGLDREAIPLQEKVRDYYLDAYGPEHPDTLGAMNNLAQCYDDAGRHAEALKLREEVLAIRRKVSGPEHFETLTSMNNLALSYYEAGRWTEALKLREQALASFRKVIGSEEPGTIRAMNELAASYYNAGRSDEAIKLQEEVLALQRKEHGLEHPGTILVMNNLAYFYEAAGRRDEALKLQEQVLASSSKVNGPEHPSTLLAMENLASSYFDAGRRDEALKLRVAALALYQKVRGPEHPRTIGAMDNLANSYNEAGRREEALKMREDVVALYRKHSGPQHPDTLVAMSNLAISYDQAGRLDEAIKLGEELLALHRKVNGPEHFETLRAMNNLAVAYDDAGRRNQAQKLREEVLALYRKAHGPEHPDTLMAMQNLAISYDEAGRRDDSLKLREEVVALRRKVLGPEHPDTLLSVRDLAISYDEAGRGDEALKLRQDLLALLRKVSGPENPDSLLAMGYVAISYEEAGRLDDALKLREEALPLFRKVFGPEHPNTLFTMQLLANSYYAAGRGSEAASLLQKACEAKPKDTEASLTLATWQTWFGQDTDYEATRRRLVQQAEGSDVAGTAERAAKAACLRASTDSALLAKALRLAQRGVELGKNDSLLPYYQVSLGLAEYRNSLYAEAERDLAMGEKNLGGDADVQGIARFFRAMCLYRQNRPGEARTLFDQSEAQMRPLPKDESKPLVDGKPVSHDQLICWLACQEARKLIVGQTAVK
jgi:eukaryotic-like serine/threonine-protein kinase